MKDLAASVRARLLTASKARREDFGFMIKRYALERLLYRLGASAYDHKFILKGAMLFALWQKDLHRSTHDMDFLGHGSPEISNNVELFKEIAVIPCPEDALVFDAASITGQKIKEDQVYEGVRLSIPFQLGSIKDKAQIDLGFGDAVSPSQNVYPTILDLPPPSIFVYTPEAVIAEKFHAISTLGMTNSRMKDFYDVYAISYMKDFDGHLLSQVIKRTFARRNTELPMAPPIALTPEFYADASKLAQWKAFLYKMRPASQPSLAEAIDKITPFLMTPCQSLVRGELFTHRWSASRYAWELSEGIDLSTLAFSDAERPANRSS